MNEQAKIVLWLGLIMIAATVIKDWPLIRSAFLTSTGSTNSGGSGSIVQVPSGNSKCPSGTKGPIVIGGRHFCMPIMGSPSFS